MIQKVIKLTDAELRQEYLKENSDAAPHRYLQDEIVSRFMARKEVPIKELLWQSFRVAFSLGYDYNAKMGDTESLFAEWFNRSSHLVPTKPDLSEAYNHYKEEGTIWSDQRCAVILELANKDYATLNSIQK